MASGWYLVKKYPEPSDTDGGRHHPILSFCGIAPENTLEHSPSRRGGDDETSAHDRSGAWVIGSEHGDMLILRYDESSSSCRFCYRLCRLPPSAEQRKYRTRHDGNFPPFFESVSCLRSLPYGCRRGTGNDDLVLALARPSNFILAVRARMLVASIDEEERGTGGRNVAVPMMMLLEGAATVALVTFDSCHVDFRMDEEIRNYYFGAREEEEKEEGALSHFVVICSIDEKGNIHLCGLLDVEGHEHKTAIMAKSQIHTVTENCQRTFELSATEITFLSIRQQRHNQSNGNDHDGVPVHIEGLLAIGSGSGKPQSRSCVRIWHYQCTATFPRNNGPVTASPQRPRFEFRTTPLRELCIPSGIVTCICPMTFMVPDIATRVTLIVGTSLGSLYFWGNERLDGVTVTEGDGSDRKAAVTVSSWTLLSVADHSSHAITQIQFPYVHYLVNSFSSSDELETPHLLNFVLAGDKNGTIRLYRPPSTAANRHVSSQVPPPVKPPPNVPLSLVAEVQLTKSPCRAILPFCEIVRRPVSNISEWQHNNPLLAEKCDATRVIVRHLIVIATESGEIKRWDARNLPDFAGEESFSLRRMSDGVAAVEEDGRCDSSSDGTGLSEEECAFDVWGGEDVRDVPQRLAEDGGVSEESVETFHDAVDPVPHYSRNNAEPQCTRPAKKREEFSPKKNNSHSDDESEQQEYPRLSPPKPHLFHIPVPSAAQTRPVHHCNHEDKDEERPRTFIPVPSQLPPPKINPHFQNKINKILPKRIPPTKSVTMRQQARCAENGSPSRPIMPCPAPHPLSKPTLNSSLLYAKERREARRRLEKERNETKKQQMRSTKRGKSRNGNGVPAMTTVPTGEAKESQSPSSNPYCDLVPLDQGTVDILPPMRRVKKQVSKAYLKTVAMTEPTLEDLLPPVSESVARSSLFMRKCHNGDGASLERFRKRATGHVSMANNSSPAYRHAHLEDLF